MSATTTRSSNPAIREVSRGLAQARDEQIMRVVAMVDAMPVRGAADQLIAPLRERLARLRPSRPLRFARLLFMPLDPLIVPAARWRPAQPAIPRTVIPALALAIAEGLGPLGKKIATMIEGRNTAEHGVIDEAGDLLWPNAARVLLDAPVPDGWEASGLGLNIYKPLSRRIAALLFQAGRLSQMMADAGQGVVPSEIGPVRAMLDDAMRHDPESAPMAIALLLARVPEAAPLLPRVAKTFGGREGILLRHASEQAAEILLDQLKAPGGVEGQLGGRDLAEAGATVRRLTSLLGALEGETLSPDRRKQLTEVRQRIREGCQSLFLERLSVDLIEPLQFATDGGPGSLWDLETAARGLRSLETEARRAGGDNSYDKLLGQTADMVREKVVLGVLDRVAGLRLMEIVAGPEAALALLGEPVD
jgi:hypothetical protein